LTIEDGVAGATRFKSAFGGFSEILVELLQGKKRKKHAPKFWAEIASQIESKRLRNSQGNTKENSENTRRRKTRKTSCQKNQ